MAKTYRGILIFVVILGIVMGLAGKKFDGYVYTNTEPRSNTECTLTQRVFDDADVLTDEEEAKLEKLIAEKEKLIGGDIVLMTTNDASLNTMEKLRDYAQNYYKENKIGWDKPIGSGAIYVDDWETKHTWLATRGTVKDKLSKDNTDYIVDETNDIVNKDPYKAYTRLINLLADETQKSHLFHINISPLWVALGCLVAAIAFVVFQLSDSVGKDTVKKSTYVKKDGVQLNDKQDPMLQGQREKPKAAVATAAAAMALEAVAVLTKACLICCIFVYKKQRRPPCFTVVKIVVVMLFTIQRKRKWYVKAAVMRKRRKKYHRRSFIYVITVERRLNPKRQILL